MRKILLHTCCGPCTTYVNKWLSENEFEVKGFFYNPNIRPQAEYERRLLTMEHYATIVGIKVIYEPSDVQTELGDCENCYCVRLKKTANFAKENGFDCFSTTLLYSKFQNHKLIRSIGESVSKKIKIPFYYHDFRDGWKHGIKRSKMLNMYRQTYCGCIYSEKESTFKVKK